MLLNCQNIATFAKKCVKLLPNQELSVLYGGGHSQLWGTIIPVCSLYAARKYDRRFGTPAIV